MVPTTTGRVLFPAVVSVSGVYPVCACLDPCANITGVITCGTCVSVGEIFVTDQVDVPGTWILTPGEAGSIEVTGSSLNPARDRIAILEANGICGISDLVAADIEVDGKIVDSFAGYTSWLPMHDVHDIQDPAWSSYTPTFGHYALKNLDDALHGAVRWAWRRLLRYRHAYQPAAVLLERAR